MALKSLVVFLFFMGCVPTHSQEQIAWLTLEEAETLTEQTPRKLFIKIATDWCDWCKRLEKETLSQPQIIRYISDNYYPVYVNPEKKRIIKWQGKEYKTEQVGPHYVNEWVKEYLHGQISFPSVVIIDENHTLIQSIPGFIDIYAMSSILNYFGSDTHKKTPWRRFEKSFNAQKFLFPDCSKP